MNEFSPEHRNAFLLASIITLGLVAALTWFVLGPDTLRALFGRAPEQPSPVTSEVIELGGEYVRTLPGYDAGAQAAVPFIEATEAGNGVWILSYSSQGMLEGQSVRYDYNVFWQDGRIISHEVRLSDIAGRLMITAPEPEQILSDSRLAVHGKTAPETEVRLTMVDAGNASQVWAETQVESRPDGTFTAPILSVPERAQRVLLIIVAGGAELRLPVLFDRGLYAPGN